MNTLLFLMLLLPVPAAAPSAEQIIEQVQEHDRARQGLIEQYEVTRQYVVANNRFNKNARMEVKVTFQAPDQKDFTVISQSGSEMIRKKALERLMKAEQGGMRKAAKRDTSINDTNYELSIVGESTLRGRDCYVLQATPRRKDELLFRGRVYVDKEDLAIVRIEGSPAKNPSFWTTKINFTRDYQKVGEVWLPSGDQSVTHVRIFGKTELTISYGPYTVIPRTEVSQ